MSQIIFEEKHQPPEENENEITGDLTLLNYQKIIEKEYGSNYEFPNMKQLIESLKEGFSLSSFTMNSALVINISIIVSIILCVWLLTIMGGIFNNFVIISGIISIVLILIMFESLSLVEKEITQNAEKEEDIEDLENNL